MRILALRDCGLDAKQIAAVMRLDFDEYIRVETIETVLSGGMPRRWVRDVVGEPSTHVGSPAHLKVAA